MTAILSRTWLIELPARISCNTVYSSNQNIQNIIQKQIPNIDMLFFSRQCRQLLELW